MYRELWGSLVGDIKECCEKLTHDERAFSRVSRPMCEASGAAGVDDGAYM